MIKYELAKKLKDAGFPQKSYFVYGPNNGTLYAWHLAPLGPNTSAPTLPELIEACGSGFSKLERYRDNWVAVCGMYETYENAAGTTPEEAVANLWLALNAK